MDWIHCFILIYSLLLHQTVGFECRQSIDGGWPSGMIRSPNYPFNYTNSIVCNYTIYFTYPSYTHKKKICFFSRRFELENSSPYCTYDFLKLGTPLKSNRYCGAGLYQTGLYDENNPYSSIWSSNLCWSLSNLTTFHVQFKSDNMTNASGFLLQYEIIDESRTPSFVASSKPAPCSNKEWRCFSRECIDRRLLCDRKPDCKDASDETYTHAGCVGKQDITACDFISEGSHCGLHFEGFSIHNTSSSSSGFALKTSKRKVTLHSESKMLPLHSYHCLSIKYKAQLFNGDKASLEIYITENEFPELVHAIEKNDDGQTWNELRINVNTIRNYRLKIISELFNDLGSKDINSWISFKSFTLSDGNCSNGFLSCNFSSSFCGWSNPPLVSNSNIPPSKTSTNHFDVNSFWELFLDDQGYAQLSLGNEMHKGILISQPYTVTSSQKSSDTKEFFKLIYLVKNFPNVPCVLTVIIHDLDRNKSDTIHHSDPLNHGMWFELEVDIKNRQSYQILLKGAGSKCNIFLEQVTHTHISSSSKPLFSTPQTTPLVDERSSMQQETTDFTSTVEHPSDGSSVYKPLSDAGIAGIVVACLLFVCVMTTIIVWLLLCFKGRYKKNRPTSSSSSTSSIISQFFSRIPGNKASDTCIKNGKLTSNINPPSISTLQKHYSGTSNGDFFPVTSPPMSNSKPSPLSEVTTLQHYNSGSSSNDTTSPSDRPPINLSTNTFEFPAFLQQQGRNSMRNNNSNNINNNSGNINSQAPWYQQQKQQQQPITFGLHLKTLEHIYEEPRHGMGNSNEEQQFGMTPSSSFSFVCNNFQNSNLPTNHAKQRHLASLYQDNKVPVEVMSTLSTHASRRPSFTDSNLLPPNYATTEQFFNSQPPQATHEPSNYFSQQTKKLQDNDFQSEIIRDDDAPTLYLDNAHEDFGRGKNKLQDNKPIFINPMQYVLANSLKNSSSNHSNSPNNASFIDFKEETANTNAKNQNYTSNNKNFIAGNSNINNKLNDSFKVHHKNSLNNNNNVKNQNIVRQSSMKTSQGEVLLNAKAPIRATCV